MTRQQSTVIWIGLLLVVLTLVLNWKDVSLTLFGIPSGSVLSNQSRPASNTTTLAAQQTPSNVQV